MGSTLEYDNKGENALSLAFASAIDAALSEEGSRCGRSMTSRCCSIAMGRWTRASRWDSGLEMQH